MSKKLNYHSADPRGLIYEAYRMEPLKDEEYRSIFLDWALGIPIEQDVFGLINDLLAMYQREYPDHPMTRILREGMKTNKTRTNRRRSRASRKDTS
ncbi:MAG: hypothetical protein OXF95_11860 [Rhodobacteraceae bacterium]|nr:hypothetical protein [Paracoccaceae bacterium]